MRTKDWKPNIPAKVLLIGEDSNLQWSDKVAEYAMFADYYFRRFPEDDGERARNVESRKLFTHIKDLTDNKISTDEVYVTNLCNDDVEQSPKGKRVLIPEEKARKGVAHIEWILSENPTIKYIFAMSTQTNYWLQKAGFCACDEDFLAAAEPRHVGIDSIPPYYQPIKGQAFSFICGKIYDAVAYPAKVIPILPAKDYPLSDKNLERYGDAYQAIRDHFKE
jgi:hypothetical protein